jgi:hypothetical protein
VIGATGVWIGTVAARSDAQDEDSFLPPAVDQATAPFRVYLSPTGLDTNSGLSPAEPINTLSRAQQVLQKAAPAADVEVRIEQGVYVAPPSTWTFVVPGRTVSFLPIDYEYGETAADIAGRPVFRGDGTTGFWLTAQLPEGHPGGDIGLRFYYLQVDLYDRGGLTIDGGFTTVDGIRRPASSGHNGNTIAGMYFTRLGSRWSGTTHHGFGAVDLVNSSNNLVLDNHFSRLENVGTGEDLIHGVYLAHHSTGNSVRGNRFEIISGDPIRIRNDSNDNDVFHNVFERTGRFALYSDWFCDAECAREENRARECPSHGNVFRENDIGSGYSASTISDWHLAQGEMDSDGGEGCTNGGQPRVRAFGNR